MTIVADSYTHIIGVDTHARTHTFAILETRRASVLATSTFPTTSKGIARALAFLARRTGDQANALIVIEGVGSFGAGLARACKVRGLAVVEPARMGRSHRPAGQKNDVLDAQLIAKSVLGIEIEKLRHPRDDEGVRAALRVSVVAREELNSERTRAINALTALLRTVDLGIDARKPLTKSQIGTVSAFRTRREDIATSTARREATRLARRIVSCEKELIDNTKELTCLVEASGMAHLLAEFGIGPVNAAVIIVAFSHTGRIRSEAAFAALSGTCPIQASSGNTCRHRLNRGGDRRLNRALSSIALTRMSHDLPTREYVARRKAEGHSAKEIRRSLKRYISRQIYRRLENPRLEVSIASQVNEIEPLSSIAKQTSSC